MQWRQTLQTWLNLWFYNRCPLCDRPAEAELCSDCIRQIQTCQLPSSEQVWPGKLPGFAWGGYEGGLKRAIAALKYNHQPQVAYPLGQWLAQAWRSTPSPRNLTVVPIPLHPAREKQRGYNQAALLGHSFCDYTGLALKRSGLKRIHNTQAQFGLSAPEREQNLARAFSLGKDFLQRRPPGPVLLLDDIYTTGTTAQAAAQVLKSAGIQVYGWVAVARAKMLFPSQQVASKSELS